MRGTSPWPELTIAEAAVEQHVDRSTIMRSARWPRRARWPLWRRPSRACGRESGLRAGAGQGRGRSVVRGAEGDGRQADAHRGRRRLGLSGRVPRRVDAAVSPDPDQQFDPDISSPAMGRSACRHRHRCRRPPGWLPLLSKTSSKPHAAPPCTPRRPPDPPLALVLDEAADYRGTAAAALSKRRYRARRASDAAGCRPTGRARRTQGGR
jgi:hypothetical protein